MKRKITKVTKKTDKSKNIVFSKKQLIDAAIRVIKNKINEIKDNMKEQLDVDPSVLAYEEGIEDGISELLKELKIEL